MTPDRIFQRIRELVADRREDIKVGLAAGSARSFDEYRERVGMLRGLEEIEAMLATIKKEGDQR